MLLRETLDAVAAVLLPAPCRICGMTLTSASRIPICEECFAQIQPIADPKCQTCGRPFVSLVTFDAIEPLCFACRKKTFAFQRARSFAIYNNVLGGAIVLLKYHEVGPLGRWFASLLEPVVRADFAAQQFDVIVPVPLHPARKRERGYNQAELIARPLARRLGLRVATFLLVRTRPRPPRLLLTFRERWETVRGAYETRKGAQVDKLRILLVDDVFTTGATLDSCSRALLAAGAASVCAVTVARVVPELSVAAINASGASNIVIERD